MGTVTRREFAVGALALGGLATRLRSARSAAPDRSLDEVLRSGMQRLGIPAVTAMVAGRDGTLYQGAFGTRDAASRQPLKADSIFAIASMTKAITSAAALQLVEQGKVSLTEPAARYLPQLSKTQVLDGFDASGKPRLRAPRTPITLHHLLTHTSGFCYAVWSAEMTRWATATGTNLPPSAVAPDVPLMFDPGARWQYGNSVDWAGKLVEAVSGLTLEDYFQRNILQPLGMVDTTFVFPASKFERLVTGYTRQDDGKLKPNERVMPEKPAVYNGGGGLYSTTADYVRFMQMILRRGRGPKGEVILKSETVAQMSANQIGQLTAGRLKTQVPSVSRDVDLHPGASDRWGLGFLINQTPYAGGRSAGSLAWAGVFNTYYWIDPARELSAVIMMQFLPFVDEQAVAMLGDFERAVYASVKR
jgi:CubicO group peptidase (beta-lactamase class C family)